MTIKKEPTIAERIERAKEAHRRAQFALLSKTPVPDRKEPVDEPGTWHGEQVSFTWRGKKITIKKNRWGW